MDILSSIHSLSFSPALISWYQRWGAFCSGAAVMPAAGATQRGRFGRFGRFWGDFLKCRCHKCIYIYVYIYYIILYYIIYIYMSFFGFFFTETLNPVLKKPNKSTDVRWKKCRGVGSIAAVVAVAMSEFDGGWTAEFPQIVNRPMRKGVAPKKEQK
jgi:hypothetical protein